MFAVTKSGKAALVEPGEEGGQAQRLLFAILGNQL